MSNKKSSVINSIFYARKVMKVKFQNGATYSFRNVPRKVFEDFKTATSLGSFFNKEIKGKFLGFQL